MFFNLYTSKFVQWILPLFILDMSIMNIKDFYYHVILHQVYRYIVLPVCNEVQAGLAVYLWQRLGGIPTNIWKVKQN